MSDICRQYNDNILGLKAMEEKLLSDLGLHKAEISLYLAVLKRGAIAPTDLAKTIGIKRTTVYNMARGLVEKGLLIEDATRRPKVFIPVDRSEMEATIAAEEKRSKERQNILAKLGEHVSLKKGKETYPVPQIRFIEEGKIESHLFMRIDEWIESMERVDPTFWGYQDASVLNHYDSWIEAYWKKAPKNFEVKLLTNQSSAEMAATKKYERRNTKYWHAATNFQSTTWVIGDYVVIINTRNQPFYLIEIHDALMAHDQREVFKNLWPLIP